MVENLPANAGDMGSSPAPGRSHMPRSDWARALQLLSLRSGARAPQLLKPVRLEPMLRNKRGHRNERAAHSNKEWPSLPTTRESPHRKEDPTQPKINK